MTCASVGFDVLMETATRTDFDNWNNCVYLDSLRSRTDKSKI